MQPRATILPPPPPRRVMAKARAAVLWVRVRAAAAFVWAFLSQAARSIGQHLVPRPSAPPAAPVEESRTVFEAILLALRSPSAPQHLAVSAGPDRPTIVEVRKR